MERCLKEKKKRKIEREIRNEMSPRPGSVCFTSGSCRQPLTQEARSTAAGIEGDVRANLLRVRRRGSTKGRVLEDKRKTNC